MDDIYKAQTMANKASVFLFKTLQSNMIQRTGYLFDLEDKNINIGQSTPSFKAHEDFIYGGENNQMILGIKYEDSEYLTIYSSFITYATCQHAYKNVLQRRAIEIQQQIAQLNRCIDKKNPNPFAGNSSMFSQSPNITYNGDGEQIGVNNATGIRPDQRTVNNYLLNWGFGLGKINTRENDKIQLAYPKYFNDAFFKERFNIINDIINPHTSFNTFTTLFESISTPTENNKPFANIASMLIYGYVIKSTSPTNVPIFIQALKLFETTTQNIANTNGILECKKGTACTCSTDCPITSAVATSITIENYNNYFQMTDISLYIVNLFGLPPMLVIKAKSPQAGDIFDIYSQGNGLGIQSMSTIQSCFGVFTSGAKNDKDACREPLTDDCGHDLDYQCKKSGLYDYINEQPVTSNALPYNCTVLDSKGDADNLACLRWIDKFFISGTIAVKPSAFPAYGLNLQSSMIEKPKMNDPHNYKPAEKRTSTLPLPDGIDDILDEFTTDVDLKKLFRIDNYITSKSAFIFLDQGMEQHESNKEHMNILLSSLFISIKPYLLPILLIITLI